jgi:hypothetical protein
LLQYQSWQRCLSHYGRQAAPQQIVTICQEVALQVPESAVFALLLAAQQLQ